VPIGPLGDVLRDGGYGYQVWTESQGTPAYVMWGFGGQFVWVVPDKNLVVVAASNWRGGIGYDGSARQADALGRLIREEIVSAAR
jgi:CubicO group peptidase (beta-lactamase class C family)